MTKVTKSATKSDINEFRRQLSIERGKTLDYLRAQLIGPAEGKEEKLKEKASGRYLMGTLFPLDSKLTASSDAEEDDSANTVDDEGSDSPVSLAYALFPSSVGISFFVAGNGIIRCSLYGAVYLKQKLAKETDPATKEDKPIKSTKANATLWARTAIATPDIPEVHELSPPKDKKSVRFDVMGGRAKLDVLWRPRKGGYIVTVTLMNSKKGDGNKVNPEDCLHQVGFTCKPVNSKILAYPVMDRLTMDEEEEELAVLYRNRTTYAIGHGCAADWEIDLNGHVAHVKTEYMPCVTVPEITTEIKELNNSGILNLNKLSDASVTPVNLATELHAFVDEYANWIKALPNKHVNIPTELHSARDRLLGKLDIAEQRMRQGINTLVTDPDAMRAFVLANHAMRMQMLHYRSHEYAGKSKDRNSHKFVEPDYEKHNPRWRPFQLAFLLLALESVCNDASDYRDVVDLIWFPTGGGKTEAYLGLAAFEIFLRRIKYGTEGEGTAVIKRYTLRLLTSQQFQRAATLICACESIRINENLAGPISLGLWVGDDASPNRLLDAKSRYDEMLEEADPENPFQLQSCPWCGTRIVPHKQSDDIKDYGIAATDISFSFFCPSDDCPFHEGIPVTIIDEAMYTAPPTFLIGTIDKFARIAWDDRSAAFFGDNVRRPPSLIIQDELHLISGPLGTIAGIYESAVDTIIQSKGHTPKIIAATATIRRSADQAMLLYGRDVSVFPPAGLSDSDSYYARTDESLPGRLYTGIMGQGHTPLFSLVQVSAALAQATVENNLDAATVDGYWTQVIFHNSRRELGKTITLARDDIPARIKVIAKDQNKMRSCENVEELSANVSGKRIPAILDRLKIVKGNKGAIDILPCTNMLSVGVDVSRLGLMIVNGQPKTTAEYIQASSRVGRDVVPGLVVAFYSATKPRDRSHYEGFRPYHEALYRAVEPTSVTPYAIPARDRALHAALVAVMRLAGNVPKNEDAGDFDPNDVESSTLISSFLKRTAKADPVSATETAKHISTIIMKWQALINESRESGRPLRYEAGGGPQFSPLLCPFDKKVAGAWPTLNSMRNVDSECVIRLKGEYHP